MTPWREAERTYYGHHFACSACIGAGQQPGILPRCEEGAVLWQAYLDAPLPWVLGGSVRGGGAVLGGNSGGNSVNRSNIRHRF